MNEVKLTKPYISIDVDGHPSFGGSQMMFQSRVDKDPKAKKNMKAGCGVVGFADLLWYLGLADEEWEEKKFFSEADYRDYFQHTVRKMGGLMPGMGISVVQPTFHFNRIAISKGSDYRAFWGLSIRKLFLRMEEMLKQDIPVYLCIPTQYFKKKGSDGLELYVRNQDGTFRKVTRVSSHYVVATEMFQHKGITWVGISSWGRKYYFKQDDYTALLKRTFLGNYTGNLLYIYHK